MKTPITAQDDETLVRRAKHDPDAFAELYRRYLNRVYRYLLSRVGNDQDAQDLTAQTFLAALTGLESYAGRGVFAAWLLNIARRKAADHFRDDRPVLPLDEVETYPHIAPTPEDAAEQSLQMERVARCLRTMSPDRVEALTLRIFGELSAAEVGQVMGKSEDAVNTLVSRALRDLRERLTPGVEVKS